MTSTLVDNTIIIKDIYQCPYGPDGTRGSLSAFASTSGPIYDLATGDTYWLATTNIDCFHFQYQAPIKVDLPEPLGGLLVGVLAVAALVRFL